MNSIRSQMIFVDPLLRVEEDSDPNTHVGTVVGRLEERLYAQMEQLGPAHPSSPNPDFLDRRNHFRTILPQCMVSQNIVINIVLTSSLLEVANDHQSLPLGHAVVNRPEGMTIYVEHRNPADSPIAKTVRFLRADNKLHSSQIHDIHKTLLALQNKLDNMDDKLKTVEDENKKLNEKLDTVMAENHNLNEKLDTVMRENHNLNEKLDTVMAENRILIEDNKKLKGDNQGLREDQGALRTEFREFVAQQKRENERNIAWMNNMDSIVMTVRT